MAPETKVGLVVGLGFIVCFAVILANRGRREPTTTYLSDLGGDISRTIQHNGAKSEARTANHKDSQLRRASSAQSSQPPRRMVPMRIDQVGSGDSKGLTQSVRSKVSPMGENRHGRFDDAPATKASSLTSQPPLRVNDSSVQPRTDPLWEAKHASTGGNLDRSAYIQPSATSPQRARDGLDGPSRRAKAVSRAAMQRHKVVSGDTLSKIAARYFGRSSNEAVRAIFEANRSVIKSPDVLRVGVDLVIPHVANAANVAVDAPPKTKATSPRPRKQRPAQDRGFRWYQIKKQDRYFSIARRELGDAGRWHEIHELNKDKFPDPSRIRAGVRIKLPSTAFASGEGA